MAKTTKNPLTMALAVILAVTATVTFGLVNIEVLDSAVKPIAGWLFIGSFIGVYMWSDRQINKLDDYEALGFVIPILAAIGVQHINAVNELLVEYEPIAGLVLLALTFGGFYALSSDMDFEYVTLEVVLGTILIVTASVQFDLLHIEMLNNRINDISVWVFFGALAGAYMVSTHSVGSLTNAELTAILVGIGGYAGYEFVPEVQTQIQQNNPHAGIALTGIVLVAYYFLMNDGSFTPN